VGRLPINWPDVSQILQRSLGLKGRVDIGIDDVAVPVVGVGEYGRSPYSPSPDACGGARVAPAVVANHVGIVVVPGAIAAGPNNSITVVRRIRLINQSGGTVSYDLTLHSPANLAGFTTVASINLNTFGSPQTRGGFKSVPPTINSMQHTALAGLVLQTIRLKDDNTADIVPHPDGFALFGDQVGGLFGLGVWNQDQNSPIECSCDCDLWSIQK